MMTEEKSKAFGKKVRRILNDLLEKGDIEIYGNLKIDVANMDTLALIKGNKIYVNLDLASYPEHVLKYIIAHELAHLVVKRHTRKFWEVVKRIYPEYERGKEELIKLSKLKLNS